MSDKDGGPAFPCVREESNGCFQEYLGMTLLDHFAVQALPALVGHEMTAGSYKHICNQSAQQIARDAYVIAAAMLKERNRAQ